MERVGEGLRDFCRSFASDRMQGRKSCFSAEQLHRPRTQKNVRAFVSGLFKTMLSCMTVDSSGANALESLCDGLPAASPSTSEPHRDHSTGYDAAALLSGIADCATRTDNASIRRACLEVISASQSPGVADQALRRAAFRAAADHELCKSLSERGNRLPTWQKTIVQVGNSSTTSR